MTEFRAWLYPFGFVAHIAFGMRFLLQWFQSEKEKRSVTPVLFWKLSLTGNILLFLHCLIQAFYPMCIAQGINGVLAWRNINLMQQNPCSYKTVCAIILVTIISTTLFFIWQGMWLSTYVTTAVWLHSVGIIGIFCLSLRFWVQWWQAECNQDSNLTTAFWWLSIVGASLCSLYFFMVKDWVNLVGPIVSLIPFSRNLWLIYKRQPA